MPSCECCLFEHQNLCSGRIKKKIAMLLISGHRQRQERHSSNKLILIAFLHSLTIHNLPMKHRKLDKFQRQKGKAMHFFFPSTQLTWKRPWNLLRTRTNMYGSHGWCASIAVQLLYAIGVLSLYQCTLLPNCTVATVQLLYAIPILTVTISVHTVTKLYGSHSTVTVCHSNPHCHYISAHCYQYVR